MVFRSLESPAEAPAAIGDVDDDGLRVRAVSRLPDDVSFDYGLKPSAQDASRCSVAQDAPSLRIRVWRRVELRVWHCLRYNWAL